MNEKVLRVACVFEFLLALVAIFTSWSEIGGQAALDLMPWGWKFGFSFVLAGALVGYTFAVASDSWWTLRSARWLAVIVVTILGIGIITYFYALQADTGESDERTTISHNLLPSPNRQTA